MLIKNMDELKSWLIVVLEPLCDADSSALARYVLALLKKDKPMDELKNVMIEQLDVFLGASTTSFINTLFAAIAEDDFSDPISKAAAISGIQNAKADLKPEPIAGTGSMEYALTDSAAVEQKVKENSFSAEQTHSERSTRAGTAIVATAQLESSSNNHFRSASPANNRVTAAVAINADKENLPRESRRRRASLRSRSRSRSHERLQRRSRSRDRRNNEREKQQRSYRNKSPPAELRGGGLMNERRRGGFIDRRRMSLHASAVAAESSRTKQPARTNRSHSRSRSPSVEHGSSGNSARKLTSRASGEKRQRCRDFEEQGYCLRGETCPWDHGVNPVVFDSLNNPTLMSIRPAEYNPDAPEIWARPNNTNASNVVLPVVANASNAVVGGNDINPFSGAPRPGSILTTAPNPVPFPTHLNSALEKSLNGADYARAAAFRAAAAAANAGANVAGGAAASNMLPFPFNPNAMPPQLQRELIPIPVMDGGAVAGGGGGGALASDELLLHGKRRFELEDAVALTEMPTKRKLPINSRLGPRVPQIGSNCSLELRKVPRGMNSIAHLNNHFAKFGKIVNIQVSYEGDPEAAIVTFSTHAEANVAYRSTEAVLNNRFIKVFWHNADPSVVGAVESSAAAMAGSGVRKNSQYHLNNVTAAAVPTDAAKTSNNTATVTTAASGTDTATTTTTTAIQTSAATTNSLRLKNNLNRGGAHVSTSTNPSIRKKQEEQAKAVVQLANGLRKRKQELLQSYLKQMKSALELLERCEPNDPQRAQALETVKELEQKIEVLRKEIATEQEQLQAQIQNQQPPMSAANTKKTKEQQKKELLDIELELFAQQQEGNDTSAIQKRLEDLQRSLGIAAAGNTHKTTHFTSMRGNARVRPEGSTRVDRRPKTIVVTGFTSEESDFVLGHFKHFGEITKHNMDKDKPQLILSYATRNSAEQAVLRGKIFKDKRLQIAWAPVVQVPSNVTAAAAAAANANNKTAVPTDVKGSVVDILDLAHESDTLPELRLEDEEEEDETEGDRSWRR